MKQVYINNVDITTYGFMPLSIDMPAPKPRLYYVDIPGKNGKLDVTSFMGNVTYQNIDIKIKAESFSDDITCRRKLNELNGTSVSLKILFEGTGEIFTGRMSGYSCKQNNSTTAIEMNFDVNPISTAVNPTETEVVADVQN